MAGYCDICMQMALLCFSSLYICICFEDCTTVLTWFHGASMKFRYPYLFFNDGNCLHGVCSAMRSDEFLGATVITNLFSVLPGVGKEVVNWLWGGFCVDNATLNRFFSLHFFLPFLISALVVIHLAFLHKEGV